MNEDRKFFLKMAQAHYLGLPKYGWRIPGMDSMGEAARLVRNNRMARGGQTVTPVLTQEERVLKLIREANAKLETELSQRGVGKGYPTVISPSSGRWIPGRGRGDIPITEVGVDGYFNKEAPIGRRFTLE